MLGWLALGDVAEARGEFDQILPENRQHPHVMSVEWHLLSREQRWEEALTVAEAHLAAYADDANAWIQRSYALHEMKRTAEAYRNLLPAFPKFPDESTIPYNLACYCCQLGNLNEARTWLKKAFATEEGDDLREQRRKMAMADPDLQPLWGEIGS